MMDMEYNRTSPFISNCLHYSSEFHPYVGEFLYICGIRRQYRMRLGIVKSEIRFPFVFALTFRYICVCYRIKENCSFYKQKGE